MEDLSRAMQLMSGLSLRAPAKATFASARSPLSPNAAAKLMCVWYSRLFPASDFRTDAGGRGEQWFRSSGRDTSESGPRKECPLERLGSILSKRSREMKKPAKSNKAIRANKRKAKLKAKRRRQRARATD